MWTSRVFVRGVRGARDALILCSYGVRCSKIGQMSVLRRVVGCVAGIGDASIRVVGFNSLLMDFADAMGASVVIRGIRGVTDFEYEYQLTGMNRQLNDRVETIFLMADVALQPIASKLVKEIALYDGDIRKFVPPRIADEVVARVVEMRTPRG